MSINYNPNKGRPLFEQLRNAIEKPNSNSDEEKMQKFHHHQESKIEEEEMNYSSESEDEYEGEVETESTMSSIVDEDDENFNSSESESESEDESEESENISENVKAEYALEEEAEPESDDIQEEAPNFSTQPFTGLINQSITFIVGLGESTDVCGYNFQNPFSKKMGVAREFVSGIIPAMQDLAQREVLLIADNLDMALRGLTNVFLKNADHKKYEMFGSLDDYHDTPGFKTYLQVTELLDVEKYSSITIDTAVKVNMPALCDARNDMVIKNLFIYLNKLQEELGSIGLRFVVGFKAEEIVKIDSRTAFEDLKERADAGELELVFKSNSSVLNEYNFDESQIYSLFEDFDVIFVKK